MLVRENQLRLSPEYQQQYCQAEQSSASPSSWLDVTDQLQRQVIREFQLGEEMDDALLCLRCATQLYPELRGIPLYVRYNRARAGDLNTGDLAPDVPVVNMDGQEGQLFNGLTEKPTVLIAGSYSWPPLRAIMYHLNELYQLYCNDMNFCFVYILEAHAEDEWPISSARWCPNQRPVRYNQTRTIDARLRVAKDFISDFHIQMPVMIDRPDENLFEQLYAPWPVRIYLLDGERRLVYKAEPSETMLELNELQTSLQSIILGDWIKVMNAKYSMMNQFQSLFILRRNCIRISSCHLLTCFFDRNASSSLIDLKISVLI